MQMATSILNTWYTLKLSNERGDPVPKLGSYANLKLKQG
jgi:hypothetical protein